MIADAIKIKYMEHKMSSIWGLIIGKKQITNFCNSNRLSAFPLNFTNVQLTEFLYE